MRLRDIYDRLNRAIGLIDTTTAAVGSGGSQKLVHQDKVRKGLEYLSEVEGLKSVVGPLLTNPTMVAPADGAPQIKAFVQEVENAVLLAKTLRAAIEQSLPSEDPNALSVRIPRPADLSELSSTVIKLREVFERPALKFFGPDKVAVRFQGFDTGSDWIEIVLATTGGGHLLLRFVVAILNATIEFRERLTGARMMEASARRMEMQNEVFDSIASLQKSMVDKSLQDLSQQVADSFEDDAADKGTKNETVPLIKESIKM